MTDKQWEEYKKISQELQEILEKCDTSHKRFMAHEKIMDCYNRMKAIEEATK